MFMIARSCKPLPLVACSLLFGALAASGYGQGQPVNAPPLHPKTDTPAQLASKPDYDNFFMSTSIGSFKMLEFNDDKQPEGHFEMSFTGTVLIDTSEAVKHSRGLQTIVHTEGNVRREVHYHGRDVYHGKGKIIVDGGWHALQWFGQDMNAKFNGCGVFRLSGEFDKNLETGYFWYSDGKKSDWGTAGMQPTVPKSVYGVQNPTVKINGKKGG